MDKVSAHQHCVDRLQKRLNELRAALGDVRESANSETKSSVGDKHETSRAMAQGEVDRISMQVAQAERQLHALEQLDSKEVHDKVRLGSYVNTTAGDFYLSVGAGAITSGSERFFALAIESPVGRQMLGCSVGDSIRVGAKEAVIESVS